MYSNKSLSREECLKMCMKNYDYYTQNFDELYEKFQNKFVVIKDCKVIGTYDTLDDAISTTSKKEELGTFIVQHCIKEDEGSCNNFYSNNIIFSVV